MHRALVALVVVLAAGPAAVGGVVADDGSTGIHTVEEPAVAGETTQGDCGFPLEVTDATGETVVIDEEPEEVVVTQPNVAQHIWEIGAREKVTGMRVDFTTSYLEGSEERTNVVGEQGGAVIETIVDLDPDIVLVPNATFGSTVGDLRDAGLTVYHYPLATDLDSVMEQVERTGELIGECEGAETVTAAMEERITTVENAVADEEPPTVFYDLGFPFTVGSNSVENDIISTAGGENLAAEYGTSYFQISEEVVASEDPEWIIIPQGGELPDVAGIQESTAVQEGQIIEVNTNFISQHGPRNVQVLEQFAEAFHPEAMAAAQATPTPTPTETPAPTETATPAETATPTESDGGMDGTPTGTPSDDDDGAGFVVVTALVAIAVLAVIGRRRE